MGMRSGIQNRYFQSIVLVTILNVTLFAGTGCAKEQETISPKTLNRQPPAHQVGHADVINPRRTKRVFSISEENSKTLFKEAMKRGLPASGILLIADTASQKAIVVDSNGIQHEYLMSSSKFGIGNQLDSNKTPLGWHKVTERIGGEQLQGRSFTSRLPDKIILPQDQWRSDSGKDYVLTRILWLTGLEPGINAGGRVDSHNRCIYIHGTNQEHLLGKPASHGCLRLSNRDVMELFDISEGRQLYCLIR